MIEKLSVCQLNRISSKREVWCWGCGSQYGRMIKNYMNEPFSERIKGLIDSNENMQGSVREIADRKVVIYSPEILKKSEDKKYILIISSDAFEEIYKAASKLFKNLDIVYTLYPGEYYGYGSLFRKITGRLPLKRQLLFYVGSNNSQPHDNADEIVRFLHEEYKGKPYSIVYLTDFACDVPEGVKQISLTDVRSRSGIWKVFRYYYNYSRSEFIFFESGSTWKMKDSQKTFYLNHGTIPLKNVKDVLKQPASLNYAVCPGPGCKQFYMEQYSVAEDKLIYMMLPRVRNVFCDKRKMIDRLFETDDLQVILWLPTFRKLERGDRSERRDSTVESPVFELMLSEEIEYLDNELRSNRQELIIKCHPREKDSLETDKRFTNIIITTDAAIGQCGLNTHNLLNRADALISDYSGIAFEYMLLDRPIGYYIPDIDDYARGFSVEDPLEYMPGEMIRNIEDMAAFLHHINNGIDLFKADRNKLVTNLFGDMDPENGAAKLLEFIDGIGERKK